MKLPVNVAPATPVADRERLFRELRPELLGLFSSPDLAELLLAYVPDEVVRKIAAEADLTIRLHLREVPRDRAQLVAENLVEVGKIRRYVVRADLGHERHPRLAEGRVEVPAAAQRFEQPDEVVHVARVVLFRPVPALVPFEVEPFPRLRANSEGLLHYDFVARAYVLRDEPAQTDV